MSTPAPITQPTADHLLALVHAYRRADVDRQDELMAPWGETPQHAAVLALSLLDLASRIAAYTGGQIGLNPVTGHQPPGLVVLRDMVTAVNEDRAAAAYEAFLLAAATAETDEWLALVLSGAVIALDSALRMTGNR